MTAHHHHLYMQRCLALAKMGAGSTATNPMVGAVLVYEERIIGEGYHRKFGEAHAEVNCINSVTEADQHLIPQSTMYVSLEPCAHYGKTPPCADLLIARNIRNVVVGCRDPFALVNGKGIEKLQSAGINVTQGILEDQCLRLNKRFFMFHTRKRPYIILKWAQTGDHFISGKTGERLLISNAISNRLVHKWRSEEMAIMVGTNTALADDPSLTTRLWPGNQPVRLVMDMQNRLPHTLRLFDGSVPTVVFNRIKHETNNNITYYKVSDENVVRGVLHAIYEMQVTSVMVEGGRRLLQSFIDAGFWDEARVITNQQLFVTTGIPAPDRGRSQLQNALVLHDDLVQTFKNPQPS
jgi:diaminohydroxyphosphoribosylaminopyrimidine deaminase / 5-amino-6-(5-phosphoribosylamino)uracil reductase